MPATHRLEIHKQLLSEEWTNAYLISGVDMDDAQDVADAILEFERRFHRDIVFFTYYLLSTLMVEDRIFRHIPINASGLLATGSNQYLPLYNTFRVDFGTLDSDPCRKYYRAPVLEAEQENGLLASGEQAAKNTIISTYFFGSVAGDNLYTPAGNVVTSGTCFGQVQMRQLHRKRKKKVVA